MEKRDIKAECEDEIAAIARNKTFWEQHLVRLKQSDTSELHDHVDWAEKHLKGLDTSRQCLENYIEKLNDA